MRSNGASSGMARVAPGPQLNDFPTRICSFRPRFDLVLESFAGLYNTQVSNSNMSAHLPFLPSWSPFARSCRCLVAFPSSLLRRPTQPILLLILLLVQAVASPQSVSLCLAVSQPRPADGGAIAGLNTRSWASVTKSRIVSH